MSNETCNGFRQAINERRWSAGVLTHFASCPSCRSYAAGISRMNRLARESGLASPPSLAPLPNLYPRTTDRANGKTVRLLPVFGGISAVTAIALATTGYLMWHPEVEKPRLMVTQRPNTWHFTGWRLVNGKRMPWNIWGQRKPFFYREEVGDYILITENDYEIRSLPAVAPGKPGVILIRRRSTELTAQPGQRSRPLSVGLEPLIDGLDKVQRSRYHATGEEKGFTVLESAFEPVFPSQAVAYNQVPLKEKAILHVDRKTRLPVHYRVQWEGNADYIVRPNRRPEDEKRREMGELDIRYGVPIPDEKRDIRPGSKAVVIDLRRPLTVRNSGNQTDPGITVEARATGRDLLGNVEIQVDAWGAGTNLRDLPVDGYLQNYSTFDPGMPAGISSSIVDDSGTSYIGLPDSVLVLAQKTRLLIPLEPQQKPPRTLSIVSTLQLNWHDRLPGEPLDQFDPWGNQPAQSLTMEVPLPPPGGELHITQQTVGNHLPLSINSAMVRSREYLSLLERGVYRLRPGVIENTKKRCRYWIARVRNEIARCPSGPQNEKESLLRECDSMEKRLGSARVTNLP